ncbi:hypothetical protein CEN45_21375, partial [Fischerella thermalis CCMEE 5198]
KERKGKRLSEVFCVSPPNIMFARILILSRGLVIGNAIFYPFLEKDHYNFICLIFLCVSSKVFAEVCS